jgi:hypothetical protein
MDEKGVQGSVFSDFNKPAEGTLAEPWNLNAETCCRQHIDES